jgi:DNA-binding CsgD family transcriptional regulator
MKSFLQFSIRQKLSIFLIVISALALWAVDAVDDLAHGSSWDHLALEGAILAFATFWVVSVALRYFVSKRENQIIRSDLNSVRADLENYRNETIHLAKGLSVKIDAQFEKWQMTKAERDIALLVLKGLSNKEVAEIRGTSEKTVIQQMSSVYQKSGLKSRSELSAFFLEDLLVPLNETSL